MMFLPASGCKIQFAKFLEIGKSAASMAGKIGGLIHC